MDCIFCKIVDGNIPSYKLYEDNDILVFLDINPVSVGHTLIIPKKHVLDIMEIDDDLLIKIVNKAKDVAKLINQKLNSSGYTLVQNNGSVQEVKHFHLHVIPRYKTEKKIEVKNVYDILTK